MATDPSWSASRRIQTAAPDCQEPALAATSDAVHAVWVSDKTLYHAHWTNGQWQTPVRFASGEQPALAAGTDGSLYCAFAHWFLGNCEIYMARWDGASWSLPQLVSRTSGVSANPTLCVAPDGSTHVAWADTTPGPTTIYHARSLGEAWESMPIPNGTGSRPALAVAPTGELYAAWQDRLAETECFEIMAATYHDGAWSVPEIISDNPAHHSLSPALAINPHGTCHLVWQEERSGKYVVRHVERLPGGWSLPTDISAPGNDARLPHIVAAPKGFLQALWCEGPILKHRARAPEHRALWWAEEVACDNCASVSALAAAITPATGELHAVWSAYVDADHRQLYHASRTPVIRHTVFIPIVSG